MGEINTEQKLKNLDVLNTFIDYNNLRSIKTVIKFTAEVQYYIKTQLVRNITSSKIRVEDDGYSGKKITVNALLKEETNLHPEFFTNFQELECQKDTLTIQGFDNKTNEKYKVIITII